MFLWSQVSTTAEASTAGELGSGRVVGAVPCRGPFLAGKLGFRSALGKQKFH